MPLGGGCIAWLNLVIYLSTIKDSVQHPGLKCKSEMFVEALHPYAVRTQQQSLNLHDTHIVH